MSTVVINVKTDPVIKRQAQKLANKLGLTLSAVIQTALRQFVRTKGINVNLDESKPSRFLLRQLRESEKDEKAGRVYKFTSAEEAIRFIRDRKSVN